MKEYTHYEYADLVERAQTALKDAEGWGDGYASSHGQTLIELIADTTDALHYMLARRTSENYMQTARLRSTVISRASDMGYRLQRILGHSGYLEVTLTDSNGTPVSATAALSIPKFTPFKFGDRTFLSIEEALIEHGESSTLVLVKEGLKESSSVPVPTSGKIEISDFSEIDRNGIFIDASDGEYLDVFAHPENKRALTFLRFNDRYYDIKYRIDGMDIVFGDNRFGARPSGNVTLILIKTQLNSPLLITGQEFEIDEELLEAPLLDSLGNEYDFAITNSTIIAGGEAEEDIDSIKTNAPLYSRTNGKAVTNADYEYWVLNSGIGSIKDAKVFGEQEILTFFHNMNNIFMTYLTEDGEKLSVEDHQAVLNYFNTLKVAIPHIVLRPATIMDLKVVLDAKKDASLGVSDAEFYAILYKFMVDYFALTEGSIGRTVHSSDVVRDLHKLRFNVGGIERTVVDFVKLQLFGHYEFTYPPKASKAFVTIEPEYNPTDGDTFILILENLVCEVPVYTADTLTDVLLRMRDKVMEVSPFVASVNLTGAALDGFGNPAPIEVNPVIGDSLLIGVDTPYYSSDELLGNFAIGSSTASVIRISPEVEVNHYYYSSPAGRRPMIPLREGTEITFTAPTDTAVEVYYRTDMHDALTETLETTILAGATFNEVITGYHSIQFEYVADSSEDVSVNIVYPSTEGTSFGLTIDNVGGRGFFKVQKTSGDLTDYIYVDYSIKLPVSPQSILGDISTNLLVPGSISVIRKDTDVKIFGDNGLGYFTYPNGTTVPTGRIDYTSGELYLPDETPELTLYVQYKQDDYDNFTVSSDTAIRLKEPKPSLSSSVSSPSMIRIV